MIRPPPTSTLFPSRRSSDLFAQPRQRDIEIGNVAVVERDHDAAFRQDRKSTRLNSSHVKNSYAVLCLKKKNDHEDRDIKANQLLKHKNIAHYYNNRRRTPNW